VKRELQPVTEHYVHRHGAAGIHRHGAGEAHNHALERITAHGHLHEEDLEALEALDAADDALGPTPGNPGWMVLNSVGIDVGSSTSHLTFSVLYLERRGMEMSSRFVTVRREILYRSPILLTPYRDAETIDVDQLAAFIRESYRNAQLEPADVHTGAVICTGEAVRKRNAEAITRMLSAMGGQFVCATAGPRLEAILAAHGSGSVARSRAGRTVLNVDVGGGTTKVTVMRNGAILETGAINVGARLLAWDVGTGALDRVEAAGRAIAEPLGIVPEVGQPLTEQERQRFAHGLVDLLLQYVGRTPPSDLMRRLWITGPLGLAEPVDEVIFSGGVGEYVYDRDGTDYGDCGPQMAAELRRRFAELPAPVAEGAESIRATVIGASQYTVQVSSSTIFLSSQEILPLRDYQVVAPRFTGGEADAGSVTRAIADAMARYDLLDEATRHPVALYLDWPPALSYASLCLLASGISGALATHTDGHPWLLICARDIGALVGAILKEDMGVPNEVIAVDEVDVTDLDFVDVGQPLGKSSAVPVIVKSLVFE
jgi:ethanolamine utilization protein EutA